MSRPFNPPRENLGPSRLVDTAVDRGFVLDPGIGISAAHVSVAERLGPVLDLVVEELLAPALQGQRLGHRHVVEGDLDDLVVLELGLGPKSCFARALGGPIVRCELLGPLGDLLVHPLEDRLHEDAVRDDRNRQVLALRDLRQELTRHELQEFAPIRGGGLLIGRLLHPLPVYGIPLAINDLLLLRERKPRVVVAHPLLGDVRHRRDLAAVRDVVHEDGGLHRAEQVGRQHVVGLQLACFCPELAGAASPARGQERVLDPGVVEGVRGGGREVLDRVGAAERVARQQEVYLHGRLAADRLGALGAVAVDIQCAELVVLGGALTGGHRQERRHEGDAEAGHCL
mmetsp:Transcript_103512/g.293293  ORF Transcript_103512/g.293293 Transcript_103512/m.293293 type:complete len:342 (+) Transcript_103512:102-1127(+)